MSRAVVSVAIAVLAAFRPAAAAPLVILIHTEHDVPAFGFAGALVGTDSFVLQLMSGDGKLLRINEGALVPEPLRARH